MSRREVQLSALAAWVGLALLALPASATTLVRAGLEELVPSHSRIVVAEAVDAHSYWNAEGTFILTDVLVRPIETLKGEPAEELTVTLMGGTVGETSTLILAGAELFPGNSYVLFLNEEELPGAPGAVTVREHVQGVFDIERDRKGKVRAVSQATSHPLLPGRDGLTDAPGGVDGFSLEVLVEELRDRVARSGQDQGVTR